MLFMLLTQIMLLGGLKHEPLLGADPSGSKTHGLDFHLA